MGTWHRIEIDGKPVEYFAPDTEPTVPYSLIYLADESLWPAARDPLSAALDRHGLHAVAPSSGGNWWLDRVQPQFHPTLSPLEFVRTRLLPVLEERWKYLTPYLGLLGSGSGGQGALQLAYRHPREFPVVAAVCPAVDFHRLYATDLVLQELFPDVEAARQETATLHLHPLNWPMHQWFCCDPLDPYYEGCERLASKLKSIGIPFEADLTTSTGGDRTRYLQQMLPRAVDFAVERLTSMLSMLA